MNNKGNLTDERPPLLPVIIGTGFGSGFWPWGPGTAGSVLATLIWAAWLTDSVLRARVCRVSPSFSSLFLPFWALGQQRSCSLTGVRIPAVWSSRDGWRVDSPVVADPVYGTGRSERCLVVGIGGTCSLPLL